MGRARYFYIGLAISSGEQHRDSVVCENREHFLDMLDTWNRNLPKDWKYWTDVSKVPEPLSLKESDEYQYPWEGAKQLVHMPRQGRIR